jgi:hypothetical protein
MGRMKELFTEYQQQMTGSNADLIDDEYHFQKWVQEQVDNDGWTEEMEARYWAEQPPYPFATDIELEQMQTGSIFTPDLFYDDEYYKSTYHPTKEEEDTAFKLFNKE